jgi:proton-dependent oligopeptide transporter, POT family
MRALFRDQPRAFYMIFLLEMWERFGFYTVQGILTLYFIRFLGFDHKTAFYTFGAFSALVYGMVAIGGFLGDKVLGTKRTIVIGLVTLCLGYLALAITTKEYVFLALGLICVGNGLFKANPSNLLAKCYEDGDHRLHGGFTLYYMAVNLGSTVALIAGPTISAKYGYPYAYLLSAIGLLIGLINYAFQRHHIASIDTPADKRPIALWHWNIIIIGILFATKASAYLLQHVMIAKNILWVVIAMVLVTYFVYMSKEKKSSVLKMILALILMFEAVIFFVLYQQMPTSINLFAINNVYPSLFGISIDPQSFQALNPLWIIVMSPLMAMLYEKLYKKGVDFPMPYKFASGMTLCGISFLILYLPRFFHTDLGIVSSWWLIASYFFQSIGELMVSALGVAMVAELVPVHITGFVMGMFFLTPAIAAFIGAYVASLTALPETIVPGVQSLNIYTHVFLWIGVVIMGVSLVMWVASPFLARMMGKKHKSSASML